MIDRCAHKADLTYPQYKMSSGKPGRSRIAWCSEHPRGHQSIPMIGSVHTKSKQEVQTWLNGSLEIPRPGLKSRERPRWCQA